MFRSLFIGFLILSALTTKGTEIQINQRIADIPADMLLEFFNAAFSYADRQTELSLAGCDSAFFNNQSESRYAIGKLLEKIKHDNAASWVVQTDVYHFSDLQCTNASLQQKQFCTSNVYAFASGLSPPDFKR